MPLPLSAFPTVVLGDMHGSCSLLLQALMDLGFADETGHWTGGTRHLVQLGDLIDRGPAPLNCLDLLMRLQAEARAVGGEVTCLIGNHELMALRAAAGDHESRLSWIYNGAGAELKQWAARLGQTCDETELPYPEAFFALFGPEGEYGRWLRTHKAACRVGEYVVVHAGWTPDCPPGVAAANLAFLGAPAEPAGFLAATAPLFGLVWARGQGDLELQEACQRLECRGLITGHTVQPGIRTSAGGRLVQIDVGMWYNGTWAAVGLAEDETLWALVRGRAPAPIAGDGLIPVPPAKVSDADDTPPPALRKYRPGDLVRIYRAADGTFQQYLLVEGEALFHGYPAYSGRYLTYSGGMWTVRPSVYFCERVDRFGRPAAPDEVPSEYLT